MDVISNTDLADEFYVNILNTNHKQQKDSLQDLFTDFNMPNSNFHLIEKITLCKLQIFFLCFSFLFYLLSFVDATAASACVFFYYI